MLRFFRKPKPPVEAQITAIPPMVQTEDYFSSLTHATAALMAMYKRDTNRDFIAGMTGDCFAIGFNLNRTTIGLPGNIEQAVGGLESLGLSVRLIATEVLPDSSMRLYTLMRAGLRNHRPCLVCGGWPALPTDPLDWCWGILTAYSSTQAFFVGSTLQATFLEHFLSQDVTWPSEGSKTTGVFLVEYWHEPPFRPGRLTRRALERGIALLSGHGETGGLSGYAGLLQWLNTAETVTGDPGGARYPYPSRLAARCQYEAIARFLQTIGDLIPRQRRATHRKAVGVAQKTGSLLLAGEPEREFGRDAPQVGMGLLPWTREAWHGLAAGMDEPRGEARLKEIAVIEELREAHSGLIEALDELAEPLARGPG